MALRGKTESAVLVEPYYALHLVRIRDILIVNRVLVCSGCLTRFPVGPRINLELHQWPLVLF